MAKTLFAMFLMSTLHSHLALAIVAGAALWAGAIALEEVLRR